MSNQQSAQADQRRLSPWQLKPWWCQPWSILLTGVVIITGSWLLFHWIWLTALVTVPILTWMGYFLLVYPKLLFESGVLPVDEEGAQSGSFGSTQAKD